MSAPRTTSALVKPGEAEGIPHEQPQAVDSVGVAGAGASLPDEGECTGFQSFTPEQEARIREIAREEIDADRLMRSGFTGEQGERFATLLKADRERRLSGSNPSEARDAR